jgi:hypothetical protein
MYEQDKLEEARYFLERMAQSPEPKAFRFELSALLSADPSLEATKDPRTPTRRLRRPQRSAREG